MKYNNKDEMKERAIKLYLEGKTYIEIAEIIGCSRNYVSNLIKNSDEVIKKQTNKILKVYKNPNRTKKNLTIGIELLSLIGIDRDESIDDYVQIIFDEKNENLILKKYKI